MAHPLRRLLDYASEHHGTVAWATFCSVSNKIFDLAPPALIGVAVDTVVEQDQSLLARWGVEDPEVQLLVIALGTVVIWGLESLFEFLQKWAWRNLGQRMQHELRLDAYEHVQQLDQAWFQDASTGGTLAILNDDVNQLERFLDGGADAVLQTATTVIAVSLTFFALSPGVAGLAMLPIPFIAWGSLSFQRRIAPKYAAVREEAGELSSQLANNLGGMETIKSFTAEEHETARVRERSLAYLSANREAIRLSSLFSPLIRMVIVLGFVATLIYGGHLALSGAMEVGSYSVLVFLTQRLLWPLTRLGEVFDLYQRAMASTDRILNLMETKAGILDGSEDLGSVAGEVEFSDVTFGYPGREPLLQGFSLRLVANETTAIVGPTGSGKSTLVRLLLRFYDPDSGHVSLDGRSLDVFRLGDLRGSIGLVSQSTFLFSGTIADNVRYGKLDATDEEVLEALEAAEAMDFVGPLGLDAVVGERGQKLSGGQAQRLSLARAILKDPRILVLDEATSAVDNETERAIQRSLATVSQGRTTLVIAHRLSTIRHAHRIVVMEEGRIAEQGTHNELVAAGGLYARLWGIQTGLSASA